MVVEEALDDDEGGGADYDEKGGIVEKIATEPEEKSSVPWTAEPDIASLHVG